jgi:putative tryptophan/tyrosine transport system substrate-binding protein
MRRRAFSAGVGGAIVAASSFARAQKAMPTIGFLHSGTAAQNARRLQGFLMSYGTDLPSAWGQAAGYVARILRGEKPAELPVAQPTKFELVVNPRAAKAPGLEMPSNLLFTADETME